MSKLTHSNAATMSMIEATTKGEPKVAVFVCEHIGMSGITKVHKRVLEDGTVELRMGFALMGSSNMSERELDFIDHNPFHPGFYDNFVEGRGKSEAEALVVLKDRMKRITDSLWAEF